MKENNILKMKWRLIICLILITYLALFSATRVFSVCYNASAQTSSNMYKVEIEKGRGDILDCKGKKITGSKNKFAVIVLPTKNGKKAFKKIGSDDEKNKLSERINSGKPITIYREQKISENGVFCFEISDRYKNLYGSEHLIGYTDAQNTGVAGLEKYYNSLLKNENSTTVYFQTDAMGNFFDGAKPTLSTSKSSNSLYLTIDRDIQTICENSLKSIKKGAVVVTEIKSGKIRACVSKPGFEPDNLSKYLDSENSPFINRALSCYNVGSVFKVLVAAELLESGLGDKTYECAGTVTLAGKEFHCYNRKGHGNMNISEALMLSCNSYFYNAVQTSNPQNLYNLFLSLGFSSNIPIADGICCEKGTSFTPTELKNPCNAANFAIGQGKVTLCPLAINNLYSAIANDGIYRNPTLIEGKYIDGEYKKCDIGAKNIVFSKSTANVLKESLVFAVKYGTGKNALPKYAGAAGKTATAQTGKTDGNTELLNAWFCGFFPEKEPLYAVTVFEEDAASGGKDCAPVFKSIADEINKLNNIKS